MAFDEQKYRQEYMKENYDQINLRIHKGNREKLKQLAKDLNVTDCKGLISVNQLIINAIEAHYGTDITSKP